MNDEPTLNPGPRECANCGAAIKEGRRYCSNCGEAIAREKDLWTIWFVVIGLPSAFASGCSVYFMGDALVHRLELWELNFIFGIPILLITAPIFYWILRRWIRALKK